MKRTIISAENPNLIWEYDDSNNRTLIRGKILNVQPTHFIEGWRGINDKFVPCNSKPNLLDLKDLQEELDYTDNSKTLKTICIFKIQFKNNIINQYFKDTDLPYAL